MRAHRYLISPSNCIRVSRRTRPRATHPGLLQPSAVIGLRLPPLARGSRAKALSVCRLDLVAPWGEYRGQQTEAYCPKGRLPWIITRSAPGAAYLPGCARFQLRNSGRKKECASCALAGSDRRNRNRTSDHPISTLRCFALGINQF